MKKKKKQLIILGFPVLIVVFLALMWNINPNIEFKTVEKAIVTEKQKTVEVIKEQPSLSIDVKSRKGKNADFDVDQDLLQLDFLTNSVLNEEVRIGEETIDIYNSLLEKYKNDSTKLAMVKKSNEEHLNSIDQLKKEISVSNLSTKRGSLYSKIGFEYYYMFAKTHPENDDKFVFLKKCFDAFSDSKSNGSSASAIYMAGIVKSGRNYLRNMKYNGKKLDLVFCMNSYIEALTIMSNLEDSITVDNAKHPKWQIDSIASGLKEVHGVMYEGEYISFLKEIKEKYNGTIVGRQLQEYIDNYAYIVRSNKSK